MEFVRAGFRGLEACWRWVAALAALTAALNLFNNAVTHALLTGAFGPLGEGAKQAVDLAADLLLIAAISAVQAVVYTGIGKFLDRPLYKSPGWTDALRRFFAMWLLINLIFLAINYVAERIGPDNPEALNGLFVLVLLYSVVSVPVAACVMFGGKAAWREVASASAPLAHFPQGSLAVVLLAFVQFVIQVAFSDVALPNERGGLAWLYASPALTAVLVIIEATIFAAVWEMCRAFREVDPADDFDF